MDLFVDGLPPSFDSKDLAGLFAGFGMVLRAEVTKNKDGNSLPIRVCCDGNESRSVEGHRRSSQINHRGPSPPCHVSRKSVVGVSLKAVCSRHTGALTSAVREATEILANVRHTSYRLSLRSGVALPA